MPEDEEIPHTLSSFEDGLKRLKESVLVMASIAGLNLRNAIEGLVDRDEDRCNRAISDDAEVNSYDRKIDEDGLEILFRFNPVATDLRNVASAMKISTNLERISDEAEHIARRAKKLLKRPQISEIRLIEPVAERALGLLEEAVRSFAEGNVDLALSLHDRDRELDEQQGKTVKILTGRMEDDVENLRSYLHLIFICRCLERIGDHAVNIGEDVVYIHRGADIRHIGPAALKE